RYWDYEPLSITTSTTDPTKLRIDAKTERLGRDEYALTINFDLNYDIDDTTMMEAIALRSPTGSEDDYRPMPWSMEKQPFNQGLKNYYADILYKNFGPCSNLPLPENVYPVPKDKYRLEKCVISGEGMPEVAPNGYYKVIYNVTGEVDWALVCIVKVFQKNDFMG
ncbi:GH21658, partial [Drosophila grimshawi]